MMKRRQFNRNFTFTKVQLSTSLISIRVNIHHLGYIEHLLQITQCFLGCQSTCTSLCFNSKRTEPVMILKENVTSSETSTTFTRA